MDACLRSLERSERVTGRSGRLIFVVRPRNHREIREIGTAYFFWCDETVGNFVCGA